jgi:pimeloyl-ACP methyl ester carboxylesterase
MYDYEWAWIGAGLALATVLVHRVFCALLFGTGKLRGQPREEAPGKFVKLSWGEVHYQLHSGASSEKNYSNSNNSNGDRHNEEPQRPLIVLIHGFGGTSAVWEKALYISTLTGAGWDVLTYDNWGHGYTEGPDTAYSVELMASQLAELLVALDISRPFDLLGFSMGGSIAVTFAERYPHRVRKLILQAPSVSKAPSLLWFQVLFRLPFFVETLFLLIIP